MEIFDVHVHEEIIQGSDERPEDAEFSFSEEDLDTDFNFDFSASDPEELNSHDVEKALSNPVKRELRQSVLARNARLGKADVHVEFRTEINEPLSPEEEKQRISKRQRNRLAAVKCRQRKREKMRRLIKLTEDLQSKNTVLQYTNLKLKEERKRLEETLKAHLKVCKRHLNRPADNSRGVIIIITDKTNTPCPKKDKKVT